jgi:non-ribosomal peptide synthetase component E (peptide arylation enzyme)
MTTTSMDYSLTPEARFGEQNVRRFRARGWWRDDAMTDYLDRWADHQPNHLAVYDGEIRLDYANLRAQAYRLGAGLRKLGVRRGERVAVQLPNWSEFVVAYVAIQRIGAIIVPIMPIYRRREVTHALNQAGVAVVIGAGEFRQFDHAQMFRDLRPDVPTLRDLIIVRGEARSGEYRFEELARPQAGVELPPAAGLGHPAHPDEGHSIVFTSGTESTAKGCYQTWNTFSFSVHNLSEKVFRMSPDDIVFLPTPVTHTTGLVVGAAAPLTTGAAIRLMPVWEPEAGLDIIEQEHCTISATATPFVQMAVGASRTRERDLSSMRTWLCAGAPIPPALAAAFTSVFTSAELIPLWGCSEILVGFCCKPGDSLERVASADGTAWMEGIEIRLAGGDGRESGIGDEGEVLYRGPGLLLGYYGEPDRTTRAIDEEGWYHSGDLARRDADGYFRISGRAKDVIIRGGSNLSAGEIEGYLLAHPKIEYAACVAFPHERLGEGVYAFIVPVKGETAPGLQELKEFLVREQGVAIQKVPERLAVVAALPMTATGKVQKFQLRDQAAQEVRISDGDE